MPNPGRFVSVNHRSSVVKNLSSYLKLVSSRALLPRPANVLEGDTRMFAHCSENAILRIKGIWGVEFRDIAVVHYTDTIVRHYRAQSVYGGGWVIRENITEEYRRIQRRLTGDA
jgi:hypothetical protein